MTRPFEHLVAVLWNKAAVGSRRGSQQIGDIHLGAAVKDGVRTNTSVILARELRTQHLAEMGRTGTGKSSLFLNIQDQNLIAHEGFASVDMHSDSTNYLLRRVASYEAAWQQDLSHRTIIIEPADPECAVGINPLETVRDGRMFVQIAECAQILKTRWDLDRMGPRTEELLRNSLHVLADNGFTLVELPTLLTNASFRSACMPRITNAEVRSYFEARYNVATPAMQAVLRDPVLNKVTVFIADPHFRHILGSRSTFSLVDAIDNGYWILLNIDKARLGEQAATLGSLFLAQLKNAFFARRQRTIFTMYLDEVQNLVADHNSLETLLSESRKFGISIFTANQYLEQFPPPMRAAILACGSHAFFRLSPPDAEKMAAALDGGRALQETLKNLPQRHFVAKIGHHRWQQVLTAKLPEAGPNSADLYRRCRARWARRRTEIEAEIQGRLTQFAPGAENEALPPPTMNNGGLDDWE
jgi:hypothetical protein